VRPFQIPVPIALPLLAALAACAGGDAAEAGRPDSSAADTVVIAPPVPLDPVPSISYPAGVSDTLSAATVRLRLFVDEHGRVVADSTRIAESSGVAALDSAAAAGAPRLRYAPALRNGRAVGAHFVQPVEFVRP
jgi:TonB family protein